MNLLLEGKRAFVSGGTRGIGAALCEVFAREGADVAFNYHSRDDLAEETKAKIEAHGRRALAYKVSVTDRFGMKHIAREILDAWGAINVLVNNAAVNKPDNFATTTDKSWDWVVDTNVNSLFAVTKPFYKQMIRQRVGSILNITSVGAIRSLPTSVHYATSKAAVQGLTHSLARDLGVHRIRVNTLVPGWVMTEKQIALWLDDAGREAIARGQCIDAPLLAQHIAHMALFLAADDSAMCTAQDFIVDGGWV